MKTLKLTHENIEECVARAAEILRTGGVILYPTDTLYGLGADALSDEAVSKVYAIKERGLRKPIHCIVADMGMAREYVDISTYAESLAREFWPGPLTLVLKKKQTLDRGIARDMETIGVRIPNNAFCLTLARAFGKPYTTTSANISGEESPRMIEKIIAQLGSAAKEIDLAIDAGELPYSLPSTVVRIHETGIAVLREGAIPAHEIWNVLGQPAGEYGTSGH